MASCKEVSPELCCADITAHEASQYAALILAPQLMDPVSHARLESLATSLGRDSVLRVELPAKQVRVLLPTLSNPRSAYSALNLAQFALKVMKSITISFDCLLIIRLTAPS